jgi:putative ABC transport system permease protein
VFAHNLLIAIRTYHRYKSSLLINLIGLSTGLTCVLLIYLWVNDELHVDKFHANDSRLFQVMENRSGENGILTAPSSPGLLGESLADEMPEVEYAATVTKLLNFNLSVGEKNLSAEGLFVGKDYFEMFSYDLINGNKSQALMDKNSIVISDQLAIKLFNTTENVIGKPIGYDHSREFFVSGIFKSIPVNSSVQFDCVISFERYKEDYLDWVSGWGNTGVRTYVLLKPDVSVEEFNHKIADYIKIKTGNRITHRTPFLTKYSSTYLHGKYENGIPAGGRIFYVKLFLSIAAFIIVIACINFMNLSTAKASRRIKEVGIKKTIGADRRSLIIQHLSESVVLTFISLVIAIGIVFVFLPQFNAITGKQLAVTFAPGFIFLVLGITAGTGLLAGSYPALYLSGFKPAAILKGKLSTSMNELIARRGLVILQFIISVILIVGVLVVYEQMDYVQRKNLGYSKENIVTFKMDGQTSEKLDVFHTEIKRIPGVINAGTFYDNLTGAHGDVELDWEGRPPAMHLQFAKISVGYDFIETMGIGFKEGHSPSQSAEPGSEIVLNEAAIKVMGLSDPIKKTVRWWGNESQIVGVVKNFNFESLHEEIKPCFFQIFPVESDFVVKIRGGMERKTIEEIQRLFKSIAPGSAFDYKFLDENYQQLYVSEQRVSVLLRYFAVVGIVISCLGLYGLVAFTGEMRTKEIGIRKVLGSTVIDIVLLLTRDFTKIVIAAILIALPISYLVMRIWLENFAFRIELHWWYFISAGLGAILIAWVTIGMQSIKVAMVNPVVLLKSE